VIDHSAYVHSAYFVGQQFVGPRGSPPYLSFLGSGNFAHVVPAPPSQVRME
jgi:hypothetical protein